ncbi:MAG: hypothetical protein ACJASQ_000118 [Crocinitomicaceae bacterium]|jgi:hypothetical protein
MCFSATASFGAGVVLTVIGIASIKKAPQKSQIMFASIPLVFGVQQIAEGVLWVTLPNPDLISTQKIATVTFLLFAQVIWPIWVPISVLLLEKRNARKTIQRILVGAGILVGVYLGYCLITFNVETKIVGYHISYRQDYPVSLKYFVILLYASSTIAPLFLSNIKRMWILGLSIAISYIIAVLFYEHYVLSVWCFFASIMSVSIYLLVGHKNDKEVSVS